MKVLKVLVNKKPTRCWMCPLKDGREMSETGICGKKLPPSDDYFNNDFGMPNIVPDNRCKLEEV